MKLLLSWIFDHIDASVDTVDVVKIVSLFNQKTAEIENTQTISFPFEQLELAQVTNVGEFEVAVTIPAWGVDNVALSARKDARVHEWCLVYKGDKGYRWATTEQFGSQKPALLPAMFVDEAIKAGSWKQRATSDVIIEIDNKSITNRPDLWGHRGIAREVAALCDLPLKPIETLVKKIDQVTFEHSTNDNTYGANVVVQTPNCARLATYTLSECAYQPSRIDMALKLSAIDAKPIDLLVDTTNYVMFDIGQPMHAFDQHQLDNQTMIVRSAHAGEKLQTLDDQEVELQEDDLVITDGQKIVSLVGVMGGKHSGISENTKAVILESGNFDAALIRKSSLLHKKRTEASMRFEKGLDPSQNILAIERYCNLLDNYDVAYKAAEKMISIGALPKPFTLTITHDFLEKRLGAQLPTDFVVNTLQTIGFTVSVESAKEQTYLITVPSWRATKDVTIVEDIVEEVGRFWGYNNIEKVLPHVETNIREFSTITRSRKIQDILANTLHMHELVSYAFFDEEWLQRFGWQPQTKDISASYPVSEHWRRLVSTLMPNLFYAIDQNVNEYQQLRFFECARVWQLSSPRDVVERKVVAGVLFDQTAQKDFYAFKQELETFFYQFGVTVSWHNATAAIFPWFDEYQTATVKIGDKEVGVAGMIKKQWVEKVAPSGTMFMFELDRGLLIDHEAKPVQVKPLSRYPRVRRDFSIFIPRNVIFTKIKEQLSKLDQRIEDVAIIDFLERDEWVHKRALTVRVIVRDDKKTLEKDEIESLEESINHTLLSLGAAVR